MRLTEQQENRLWWASRILILVVGILAFMPAFIATLSAVGVVSAVIATVTSAVVTLVVGAAGYTARWCEQHLDPSRGIETKGTPEPVRPSPPPPPQKPKPTKTKEMSE